MVHYMAHYMAHCTGALFLDRQPLGMAHAQAFTHTALFALTPQAVSSQ